MVIHAFGDSYTNGFNDDSVSWVKKYIKWKGYKPKGYIEYISEYYNCEFFNHAIQGADNYTILESFCNKFEEINEDDLIILNWSGINRFRIVNNFDKWITILPNFSGIENQSEISVKTANEILVNRTSLKYLEEVKSWTKLINYLSKERKIFQWSYLPEFKLDTINNINLIYETITTETKGVIIDSHLSEVGNKNLSKEIIKLINRDYI